MGMPLVVGVDGSASSLRALDWAADEAERRLSLRIVHASLWDRYELTEPRGPGMAIPSAQVSDQGLLTASLERVRRRVPDLEAEAEELTEDPEAALLKEAYHRLADHRLTRSAA